MDLAKVEAIDSCHFKKDAIRFQLSADLLDRYKIMSLLKGINEKKHCGYEKKF